MPKKRNVVLSIPAIYRANVLDAIMFGYVTAILRIAPGTAVPKAMDLFMDEFELSEDNYKRDSACTTYYKMLKDSAEINE